VVPNTSRHASLKKNPLDMIMVKKPATGEMANYTRDEPSEAVFRCAGVSMVVLLID
jgi:hypothetical protein